MLIYTTISKFKALAAELCISKDKANVFRLVRL